MKNIILLSLLVIAASVPFGIFPISDAEAGKKHKLALFYESVEGSPWEKWTATHKKYSANGEDYVSNILRNQLGIKPPVDESGGAGGKLGSSSQSKNNAANASVGSSGRLYQLHMEHFGEAIQNLRTAGYKAFADSVETLKSSAILFPQLEINVARTAAWSLRKENTQFEGLFQAQSDTAVREVFKRYVDKHFSEGLEQKEKRGAFEKKIKAGVSILEEYRIYGICPTAGNIELTISRLFLSEEHSGEDFSLESRNGILKVLKDSGFVTTDVTSFDNFEYDPGVILKQYFSKNPGTTLILGCGTQLNGELGSSMGVETVACGACTDRHLHVPTVSMDGHEAPTVVGNMHDKRIWTALKDNSLELIGDHAWGFILLDNSQENEGTFQEACRVLKPTGMIEFFDHTNFFRSVESQLGGTAAKQWETVDAEFKKVGNQGNTNLHRLFEVGFRFVGIRSDDGNNGFLQFRRQG
ncbi:MAG: hypothetical protein HOI80_00240 [Alphaproteobacteria bacterium]|mgnify:CR=1 FL=1|nr:hypothetical protein [Alphaproteobacteria bacterium]MBT5389346.1 hypothetical protein [Alphaproteobacteria bacterium]MBT5540402.1 hypothetical protein [Alphaproteobacteria bacterium]MBT5653915.1 hypothetical protein [Alphaproteobacteria bacterium]